jgi:hypothetical protein
VGDKPHDLVRPFTSCPNRTATTAPHVGYCTGGADVCGPVRCPRPPNTVGARAEPKIRGWRPLAGVQAGFPRLIPMHSRRSGIVVGRAALVDLVPQAAGLVYPVKVHATTLWQLQPPPSLEIYFR